MKKVLIVMLVCVGNVSAVKNQFFDLNEHVFNTSISFAMSCQNFPGEKSYVLAQLEKIKTSPDKCVKMREFMRDVCAPWIKRFYETFQANTMVLALRKIGLEDRKAELLSRYKGDEARAIRENPDYIHAFEERFQTLSKDDLFDLEARSVTELCDSFAQILPCVKSGRPFLLFENKEHMRPYIDRFRHENSMS